MEFSEIYEPLSIFCSDLIRHHRKELSENQLPTIIIFKAWDTVVEQRGMNIERKYYYRCHIDSLKEELMKYGVRPMAFTKYDSCHSIELKNIKFWIKDCVRSFGISPNVREDWSWQIENNKLHLSKTWSSPHETARILLGFDAMIPAIRSYAEEVKIQLRSYDKSSDILNIAREICPGSKDGECVLKEISPAPEGELFSTEIFLNISGTEQRFLCSSAREALEIIEGCNTMACDQRER